MVEDQGQKPNSLLELGSRGRDPVEGLENIEREETFTAEHKKAIALDQVRRAVRRHGEDGIAVSDLVEITGLSRKTVDRHLDTLRNLREVYREKKGKQMYLYYPNGRPLHGVGSERVECSDGDTVLELQLAQGRGEELFFHVSEKRFSLLEGESHEGAIMFPTSDVDELIKKLETLKEEVGE